MIVAQNLFLRTTADGTYPGATLRGVHFTWQSGVLAILGAPRDGTHALLTAIAGQRLPTQGDVRVLLRAPATARSEIAFVPREPVLPDAMRVSEVCALAADLRGEARSPAEARLAPLGMQKLAARWTSSLSKAEARAVMLCLALSSKAHVLLVEEPLVNVEAGAASLVIDALRARGAAGASVVVTTASVRDATRLGDQLALLTNGVFVPLPPSYAHAGRDGARLRVVLAEDAVGLVEEIVGALRSDPHITEVVAADFASSAKGLVVSGHDLLAVARATTQVLASSNASATVLELAVMPLDGIRFTLSSPRVSAPPPRPSLPAPPSYPIPSSGGGA